MQPLISIAKKNKLYKSYLKNRNEYYFSRFKIYRNKLKHLLTISKKSYSNNYFKNSTGNMKNVWKGIKQLVTLKKSSTSIPSMIEIDNVKLINSNLIANAFNNYFSNVGSNVANNIPRVNATFHQYLSRPVARSFQLSPTTAFEIEDEISKFIDSKAAGPSSIPTNLLKMLKTILSTPLANLFNCSFLSGVVPDKLKLACVIPVYKKGTKIDVSNYRPISLLSIFIKY